MAATNFKPEFTVCKTESDAFTGMIENHELVRKNSARRLHGNQTNTALVHPRAETPQDSAACCELYAHRHEISSSGRRLVKTGGLY